MYDHESNMKIIANDNIWIQFVTEHEHNMNQIRIWDSWTEIVTRHDSVLIIMLNQIWTKSQIGFKGQIITPNPL